MKSRCITIILIIISFIPFLLFANNSERPSNDEIRKYIKGTLPSYQQEVRVAKWIINNRSEVLPVVLDMEINNNNTLALSAKFGVIKACTTSENAQSIIDRLLQAEPPDISKTTALEIAEKYGFRGERYRTTLLEVLSTTEYGGLQKTLLIMLRSYGREEDAELVLDVFKNTDNRDIKSLASDTLLAIGGPGIIGPWEEFWGEWKEEEPDRQREKREKEEKMAREIGVELPPRRPSKFIQSIDDDIQILKEKVAAQEAGYTQEENPKSSLQGGGEEGDEVRASSTGGQSDTGSKSARPWRSFPIVLAGMIALAVLIALARIRKA